MQPDVVMQSILGVGVKQCLYCGKAHDTVCPEIKAVEYDAEGNVTRVELLTPIDRPQCISGPGEIKFFEGR